MPGLCPASLRGGHPRPTAARGTRLTGITATRRLGSRLASFVSLTEVLMALLLAWLLLGEAPGAVQLVGGALILTGVVVVRLGEPRPPAPAGGGRTPVATPVAGS